MTSPTALRAAVSSSRWRTSSSLTYARILTHIKIKIRQTLPRVGVGVRGGHERPFARYRRSGRNSHRHGEGRGGEVITVRTVASGADRPGDISGYPADPFKDDAVGA